MVRKLEMIIVRAHSTVTILFGLQKMARIYRFHVLIIALKGPAQALTSTARLIRCKVIGMVLRDALNRKVFFRPLLKIHRPILTPTERKLLLRRHRNNRKYKVALK